MTPVEFEKMLEPLNLSCRSYNALCRVVGRANCEYETRLGLKKAGQALLKASSYAEVAEVVKTYYKHIPCLGAVSRDEVVEACAMMQLTINEAEESEAEENEPIPIENGLPPCGVPLMVHTRDNLNGGAVSIKYPVYYAKDPYSLTWKWWFFPAMEGMTVLLPEYSEVLTWQEIK